MHALVRQKLSYDPDTGEFRWREGMFHSRMVGRLAGYEAGITKTRLKKYRMIKLGGKLYLAHRLAFLYMTGRWPEEAIDHINGNGLDNRWANLREATMAQNSHNRAVRKTSKTGVRGVYPVKGKNLFVARPVMNGKRVLLGYSRTLDEAAAVLKAWQAQNYGAFAPG